MSEGLQQHDRQPTNGCLHFSGSVSGVANTPITEAFARTADWKSAMEFCRRLERRLNAQREALEAADECLALIEDVGHGAMSDNVTVARGIVLAALSQNKEISDHG
jgi:hypothetical protein